MINSFTDEFRFLSNFFADKKVKFTVEHLYQAAKTKDREWKERIFECLSPGQARQLGKKAPMKRNWDDIKIPIMKKLVHDKFLHLGLALRLTDTYPEELVEGNKWHDNFWGDCSCPKCINIKGQNHLGKILMKIREYIIKNNKLPS